MGQAEAKGSVHVSVERGDVEAGAEVSGLVYLYLKKRIRTDTLWLKVKCKEECHWRQGGSDFSNVQNRLRQKFPLWKRTEKEFAPGSYSVPFSVILPSNLPGSFRYTKDRLSASIAYKIKAEINGNKTHLTHHQALKVTAAQSIQKPGETSSRVGSCCVNRGEVRVRAGFERNEYRVDEVPKLIVEIDNSRSTMEMARMSATLYRVLRLRTAKGTSHIVKYPLATVQRPERIPPQQSLLQEKAITVPISLHEYRTELDEAPSVKGEVVECAFEAEVQLLPSASYCKPIPPRVTAARVCLQSGSSPPVPLPSAPEDWAPYEVERASLSVQPQFDYLPSAPPLEDTQD